MKARYCPCRGVKPGRSSGEVVSISSPRCAGHAMNIRFRVELSEAERDALAAMLSGGRGSLTAGALEMSNVDLAEEFTGLIVAQRGFQANSRVITTSHEIPNGPGTAR